MKNKKTFLVTGGTGFIGRSIVRLLLKKNYNVIVFDNDSRGSYKKLEKKKIKFFKGDIRKKKDLYKSLKSVNAVIHLAYVNGTKFFYSKPEIVLDVAIKGLVNVFDGCKKFNIKELYLASSSEVYQTPLKIPTNEKEMLKIPDVFNPRYSYAGGKILTELMGVNYGKKYFKKLVIFRPHNVFGPEMGNEHVIPEFIKRMQSLKGNKFKIEGTGKEIRTFIFIDDFIRAFDLILQKGKHLNIYNIGTQEKVKIGELARKIADIFNKNIKLMTSPLKKGGTKIRVPDIKKIKNLGFKPIYSIEEGLIKTINF